MRIGILGPLAVTSRRHDVAVTAPAQRTLLVLLATHRGETLSTDRIVDALWDDHPPGSPLRTLRYHVSMLRRALGPDGTVVVTANGGYRLDESRVEVDADQFEHLFRQGADLVSRQPDLAVSLLGRALDLWRGDALADAIDRTFAIPESIRLTELQTAARERLIEARINRGADGPLVAEIRAMLTEHPYREELWRLLMLASYRRGEQADALRACREAVDAFADLGLEPSDRLRALEQQILVRDPRLCACSHVAGNLPFRASSFVGRDDDEADAVHLLDDHRIVTITGPGGIGKTSVAIEAARSVADRFADGAWMVELSAELDPRRIAADLAAALDLSGAEQMTEDAVIDRLADRSMLILLDGCEHLIDAAAALVDHLVKRCPAVWVLAASRERLEIPGEAAFPLVPLSTEPCGSEGRPHAAALFLDRAACVEPGLRDDLADDPAVDEICRRLDGIPLAIEMAAARTRCMSPAAILERLDGAETLRSASRVASSRHASMDAAIEWSYRLLLPAESTAFRRLASLQGSFTLADAERAIAAEDGPTRPTYSSTWSGPHS